MQTKCDLYDDEKAAVCVCKLFCSVNQEFFIFLFVLLCLSKKINTFFINVN